MLTSHDAEIQQAKRVIESLGLKPGDFVFDVQTQPPDSETPGMFVLTYEVEVNAPPLQYRKSFTGGGRSDWVEAFESDLKRHLSNRQ